MKLTFGMRILPTKYHRLFKKKKKASVRWETSICIVDKAVPKTSRNTVYCCCP